MHAARLLAALGALAGCATGDALAPLPPMGALEAQHLAGLARPRAGGPTVSGDLAVTTWTYRQMLSPSLGSRCKMWPSDSTVFDQRARTCGAFSAAVLGAARLLLEVGADPALLPTTVLDGRVRFVDPPAREAPCSP